MSFSALLPDGGVILCPFESNGGPWVPRVFYPGARWASFTQLGPFSQWCSAAPLSANRTLFTFKQNFTIFPWSYESIGLVVHNAAASASTVRSTIPGTALGNASCCPDSTAVALDDGSVWIRVGWSASAAFDGNTGAAAVMAAPLPCAPDSATPLPDGRLLLLALNTAFVSCLACPPGSYGAEPGASPACLTHTPFARARLPAWLCRLPRVSRGQLVPRRRGLAARLHGRLPVCGQLLRTRAVPSRLLLPHQQLSRRRLPRGRVLSLAQRRSRRLPDEAFLPRR